MPAPSVLWFRRDLRLGDHPALAAAAEEGPVVGLVVLDPHLLTQGRPRTDRFLASVADLQRRTGGALVIRTGDPVEVVPALAQEVGARTVHITRETTPYGIRRDTAVVEALRADGRDLVPTGSPYAVSPGNLLTGGGTPFKVFTPYLKAWREHGWPPPAPDADVEWVTGLATDDLPEASSGVDLGPVGEEAALEAWRTWVDEDLADYDRYRDEPDMDGTSHMSVHLKYGEIHPRTLLADLGRLVDARRRDTSLRDAADKYASELAWRDFYADVLWQRPDSAWADLKAVGVDYDDPGDPEVAARIEAWKEGRTGYPFVDAGMRELLATGFMHNRLRMVTASFLAKDLHVWWPVGARHFLDHLLDGDLASNNHGWQWAAGTGTDAAPYFRVFNPVTQGTRFDADGAYVRRWVPELAHLSGKKAHEPWKHADGHAHGYPERIVDHAAERTETLARFDRR